jgi:hypothetical protein
MTQTKNTDFQLAYLVRELDATIVASEVQAQRVSGFALQVGEEDSVTLWSNGFPICSLRPLAVSAPIWVVPVGGGEFPTAVHDEVQAFVDHEIVPGFRKNLWDVVEVTRLDSTWFRITLDREFENVQQLVIALRFLADGFSVCLDPTEVVMWALRRLSNDAEGATMEVQS